MQAQSQPFPITFFNPLPSLWPLAPPSESSRGWPKHKVASDPHRLTCLPFYHYFLLPSKILQAPLKIQHIIYPAFFLFSEFSIAFSRYSKIICAALPNRSWELNDYLAIIAELALSYGGTHFYTYYKLFSAKCAVPTFKVMPIHPDSWHLFGICWLKQWLCLHVHQ